MPWVDFDKGVRVAANFGGVKIRGVEQAGEDGLACGAAVDGKPSELAQAAPRRAQSVDLRAIELVRG